MFTIGSETVAFVKPHTTVVVQGGGGSIQRVPWNVPGFGAEVPAAAPPDLLQQLAERIRGMGSASAIQAVLAVLPTMAERQDVAVRAMALGADGVQVQRALDNLAQRPGFHLFAKPLPLAVQLTWGILSTASFAASVYHGYKRNDSLGWALGWGAMGALFPVITPTIALAQGFGQPKHARGGFARRARRSPRR